MKKIIFISFLFAVNVLFSQKKYDYHPEFDKLFNKADSVSFVNKDYYKAIEIYKSIINTNGDFEDLLRCKLNSYVALSRIYKNTKFDGHDFNLAYLYLKEAVEARNIYRIKAGFKTKITSDTDDLARDMSELVQKYQGCENGTYVSSIAKVDNKALKKDTTITSTQTTTNSDKTVTITVSGSGKSQDEAKQSALRSAIEQAFGAFISAKTEILNDQVISDQITSVASGNIQSFDILNASQLPDGSWGVTLKATISIDKLTSFVEAKGVTVEIKGGLFALNIKQQILNEQAEFKTVCEMVGLLHEPIQTAFDYTIKTGEPISVDSESKNWEIPLMVTVTSNTNMEFCSEYIFRTLKSLSLSVQEIESYKKLKKQIFKITIVFKGSNYDYYLRNGKSIIALSSLTMQWNRFVAGFTLHPVSFKYVGGKADVKVNINGQFNERCGGEGDYCSYYCFYLNLPSKNSKIAEIPFNAEVTLNQIEQLNEFTVVPNGICSKFKNGGYVIKESNGHGIVLSLFNLDVNAKDIGELGIQYSDEFYIDSTKNYSIGSLNGYNDWRLPTKEEMDLIAKENKFNIHTLNSSLYHYFCFDSKENKIFIYYFEGNENQYRMYRGHYRPVRSF